MAGFGIRVEGIWSLSSEKSIDGSLGGERNMMGVWDTRGAYMGAWAFDCLRLRARSKRTSSGRLVEMKRTL